MRRPEKHFASPAVADCGRSVGRALRAARVARRHTRAEAAVRARVSLRTLSRIEAGDVAVAFGSWLAYAESMGLLGLFAQAAAPEADRVGQALREEAAPKRVRRAKEEAARYDF